MMALALLDADFQAILAAGNWSNTSEDHKDYYAEQLPVALVQRWVQDYDPTRIETTVGQPGSAYPPDCDCDCDWGLGGNPCGWVAR